MLVGLEAVLKGSKATKAYKKAQKALDMIDEGKDLDKVFRETGVDLLSDTDSLVMEFPATVDLSKLRKSGSESLDKVILNDELFEVQGGAIAADVEAGFVAGKGGGFYRGERRIGIGAEFREDNGNVVTQEKIAAHEAQHVFQWAEGRPYGMNPMFVEERLPQIVGSPITSQATKREAWKALDALAKGDSSVFTDLAYRLYRRSPGEIEARVTETRDIKNNPARKFIRPDKTYRMMMGRDKILDKVTFEFLDQINFEELKKEFGLK